MALFFTKLSESLLADPSEATKYVEQTIWHVAFQDVPERKVWEESVGNSAKGTVYLAMGNKLPQPNLASEETVANEKSLLDETLKQQYDSKIECFVKATAKGLKSTLQEKEIVEEERFTYLEMPFKCTPKHTPVFLRRTNMAEYCLIVTGYLVRINQVRQDKTQEGSGLIFYQAPTPPTMMDLQGADTEIAKALALGLLSGVASKVGVLIFNAIFPPGDSDYFTEVYTEIEKIVHQELTQNTINEINGKINGLKNWVAIVYTNAKESGTLSKKELTDMIQPQEPTLAIDLVGVLMEENFAKPGICVFMIAAGMHLAMLQELALVDPNVSPKDSPYIESVKDYAETYANHAKTTTDAIISTRLGMIKPHDKYRYNNDTSQRYYFYSFKDDYTGYDESFLMDCDSKGCHNTDAEQQRNDAMEKYKDEKRNEIVAAMEDPAATANEWLKLKTQPLPTE